MADVYLSFAADDAQRAELIAWAIEERGWSVHRERPEGAAIRLPPDLEAELHQAGCVVALWSKASKYDRWVRRESVWARDAGKLVHVLLDDVRPSYEHRHFEAHDLTGWDPGTPHPGLSGLIAVLEAGLRSGPDSYHLPIRTRLHLGIWAGLRSLHGRRRLERLRLYRRIRSVLRQVRDRSSPAAAPPPRERRRRPRWRRLFGR